MHEENFKLIFTESESFEEMRRLKGSMPIISSRDLQKIKTFDEMCKVGDRYDAWCRAVSNVLSSASSYIRFYQVENRAYQVDQQSLINYMAELSELAEVLVKAMDTCGIVSIRLTELA